MPFLFPLLAILIWAANTVVSKAAAGVLSEADVEIINRLLGPRIPESRAGGA